jgi:hypothetical protein
MMVPGMSALATVSPPCTPRCVLRFLVRLGRRRCKASCVLDVLERMRQSVPHVRDIAVIGLLSSVVSDIADPDVTVRKLRKDAYDAGLLVRIARDGTAMSAHFRSPRFNGLRRRALR